MKIVSGLIAITAMTVLTTPADARLVHPWTYEELLQKADLALIARPVAKTRDTREHRDFPDVVRIGLDNKEHDIPAVGVETRFRILAVLKGKTASSGFVLHHYREERRKETTVVLDGEDEIFFEAKSPEDFLLFLIKEKDGRYAPLSGQADISQSIVKINSPLDMSPPRP